jgi:ribosome-associated toxin RatA of RatAB toxin-antitoxin module
VPVVRVEQAVAAPLETVWGVIRDVEARTRLMGGTSSVEVRETGPGYRVTAREAEMKGCLMRWTEREEIDDERHRLETHLLDGDLAVMDGRWQLDRLADGTVNVSLTVTFDIGVPELSDMLDPVAERAIHDSSARMLLSLAAGADTPVV